MASGRRELDLDVLLAETERNIDESRPELRDDFRHFARINRALRSKLANLQEPDEFASSLERSGCWTVLEARTSYLDQEFFVSAVRR